jgi:phage tail-like protein
MPSVTLTPMQLPPAAGSADSGTLAATVDAGPERCQLRLSPGEPSELVVQVRNDRDQPLTVAMQVRGDFPSHWSRVGQEGNSLPPGRQMDGVVQFAIPPDHFERHPLGPGQVLQINYSGQVVLEGRSEDGGSLQWQTTAPFTLVVRPHSLYPRFLPSLYREVDFMGRLLAVFEQTFEPAVQAMDTLWAHLDPLTAPQQLLPFLAHWVGWQALPQWPLADQRRLIRRAMEIYRYRGTRKGLSLYLHLYTGLPLPDSDTPPQSGRSPLRKSSPEALSSAKPPWGKTPSSAGVGPSTSACACAPWLTRRSTKSWYAPSLSKKNPPSAPTICSLNRD